jgi:SHS2 domain-containing protein
MYEVFEHTADVGLRVRAASRDTLFAEAGQALFSLIVANLDEVRTTDERHFRIEGEQLDYLLFDWLSELLYTFETAHLLLREFDVRVDDTGLTASCRGEPLDPERHPLDHEVKAITYHELLVEQSDGEWLAEVVLDI